MIDFISHKQNGWPAGSYYTIILSHILHIRIINISQNPADDLQSNVDLLKLYSGISGRLPEDYPLENRMQKHRVIYKGIVYESTVKNSIFIAGSLFIVSDFWTLLSVLVWRNVRIGLSQQVYGQYFIDPVLNIAGFAGDARYRYTKVPVQ